MNFITGITQKQKGTWQTKCLVKYLQIHKVICHVGARLTTVQLVYDGNPFGESLM